MNERYNFNISLSVLNHLGRNLYRNIITVIGEAISNSWDADAHNVWITIDRSKENMSILDDGIGMDSNDFQDKFLKIGYSKRKNNQYKSGLGRPYIGRKGIGKLALLSCSNRVHIVSKTETTGIIGGIIDNSGLDEAIRDDISSQDYTLDVLEKEYSYMFDHLHQGTLIEFEKVKDGIYNTVDYIKRAIALYFRFSLIDNNFNIYVNDELISASLLERLYKNTQYLWKINGFQDSYIELMKNVEKCVDVNSDLKIRGYIATVLKPSNLKIQNTQEKVTVDLFVNGRLREKDILRHIPTARIVENYVYGQIHFDEMDLGDGKDVFTSSREGVISDDPLFVQLLSEVDRIFKNIIENWDEFRVASGDDGDPDNLRLPPKARKARELFSFAFHEYEKEKKFSKSGLVKEWENVLGEEAQFNIPSYAECFIAENLLRKYVLYVNMPLSESAISVAEKWRNKEQQNKGKANISYEIRSSEHDLYYLDMDNLANLVDKVPADKPNNAGISRSAHVYKPLRDAVGHTSLLTDIAKSALNIEYENIKKRLEQLLKEVDDKGNGS